MCLSELISFSGLQKLCRIHSLVLCYVDKSHTSAFFFIFFSLLTFCLEEFNSQNFPLLFNMSQLRLRASLFRFLYVFLMTRILLWEISRSLCVLVLLYGVGGSEKEMLLCVTSDKICPYFVHELPFWAGSAILCQEVPYADSLMCTFPHASTQTFDTCRLPAIISMLPLTCTVLSIPDTILESPEFRQV